MILRKKTLPMKKSVDFSSCFVIIVCSYWKE